MNPDLDQHDPFEIDRARLDVEWLGQPRLSREAGRRRARAALVQARAEAARKLTKARLYLAVRGQPGAYGLRDKPTVDEVDAAVEAHDDYAAAVATALDAQHELDVADADVTAYIDRRKALESLVQLTALNYATEKAPVAKTRSAPEEPGIADPRKRRHDDEE